MLNLEAANRFDSLIWQVRVPVSDLSRIRESFIEARGSLLLSAEGMEVSLEALIYAVKELEATVEKGAGDPLPPPLHQGIFRALSVSGPFRYGA
jgi:hypothetical protein